MTGSDDAATFIYTTEQVRRMLPEGASATQRAIGTRCRRAGATFMHGWPVDEIEQVKSRKDVVSVQVGDEPIRVYTLDQVMERLAHLGWHPSDDNFYFQLREAGVRAARGYAPPDRVKAAMLRPAGRDWRRNVKGGLAGRTFTE